jgi:hypothetical protein
MKMDVKVWATGEDNKFKICRGMDALNRHYDTNWITMYEVESMAIDHIIMGYSVITNFVFADGIDGVVKRRVHSLSLLQGEQVCSSGEAICDRGNSEDEPIKVVYEEAIVEPVVEEVIVKEVVLMPEIKVIYEGLTESGILPSDN